MPLGHEPVLDLRTLQKALSQKAAGADGDLRLVDVVVRPQRVADDAQEAQDTVLLVGFEDRIENIVGRRQENHRAEEQPDRNEDIVQVGAVGINHHPDQRQQRHGQEAGMQIHEARRDKPHRHAEQDAPQGQCGKVNEALAPVAVHHRLRKGADQDDRHEHRHGRKQEREDEQRGDQQHRNAEPLVEPFAVEHEEKRPEHDARTGIVLQDDDKERDADHHPDLEQVARPVDRERIGAHHAGERQCRGDLHELDRLHAERPELEPRLGPVDLAAEQQCTDQQRKAREIGRVGEHMVKPIVEQQHDDRRSPCHADPHQLFHVEVRKGEDIGRTLVVRGRSDRHPPRHHDQDIQQNCPEVDTVEDTVMAVSGHTQGNLWSCS